MGIGDSDPEAPESGQVVDNLQGQPGCCLLGIAPLGNAFFSSCLLVVIIADGKISWCACGQRAVPPASGRVGRDAAHPIPLGRGLHTGFRREESTRHCCELAEVTDKVSQEISLGKCFAAR